MLRTLKKFFAFCGEDNRKMFIISIWLGVVSAICSAMRIPAAAIVIQALLERNVTMATLWTSLGIIVISLIITIAINMKATMLQTRAGYRACANKRIEIAEHLRYLPMGGIILAFKNYKIYPKDPTFLNNLIHSKWVGLDNFKFLFTTGDSWVMIRNTLAYNIVFIILGVIIPVAFAVMMNEITRKFFKKAYQTMMFFPYFLSWVVVSYFLNAAVSNENGIIADIEQNPYDVKMNHQKYIFQSNVSANITKTTVVGIKVNAQLEYNTRPIEDIGNLFYYSMRANPVRFPATLPAEEGDTFVRYGNNASWDPGATDLNPLAKLSRGYGKRYYSYMTTAFTLDQNLDFFTKGLSANLTASFYNYTYSATYRTATPYYFKVEDGSSLNPDGTANLITNSIGDTGTTYLTSTDGNGGHRRYALQASLNYARKFGKHDVGAMFVYRMNEKKNNIAGTSEENLLPYREQGMAGRVTYGFDNRYLFEASFGYNGSENFAPGKRWGFFPSAAAGWVISNESFWDGIRKTVSNLKIRVSYGLAGNDALGERFPYRSIVAMGEESGFYYNWNSQGKGPKITTYGNPNATWEEAKKLDVGLELGLFNALNIEAAYFTEDRTGIFMRRTSLPSSTGLLGVTPYGNIGRVKSHGVDLSAVYNKQFNKDWSLSLRGTFTFSRNEVVEKDEGDLMYDYMSVVGHPVNAITGVLVADGLFTSQEEIDNSPKQQFGNYTVGDIKYRDLNGDGIVDGNDVTTAGSPTVPEIQYGIGATVKWRRLDFSFMFQGASNVSLRMYNMHPFCDASHFGYGITQYIADNHWSEDNNRADAAYPRLTSQLSSNNTQSSTFYIHDAKYLRLKTVELGYTIKKLRVYLSGNNLFVISPFDYWDPEKGGGHGLSYPLQRTAKIGVQYQF